MGNQRNVKQVRGQVRQIIKELLPEILGSEVINTIEQKLTKQATARLELITKNVQDTMKQIDDRAKDVQAYLVRQTTTAAPLTAQPASVESDQNKAAE